MRTPDRPRYRDQSEMRDQLVAPDQFGRPWLVTIDKDSGAPSGPLMPCRAEPQWREVPDDLVPPMHYVALVGDRVHVDTERWKADVRRRIDPRTREPQRVTPEQLATWRRILEAIG